MRIQPFLAALFAIPGAAAAQAPYPVKPVRLVVPFPPGGTNDVLGRIVAQQLAAQLGQQFVVDNRGGAGGVIGTEAVAHAAPDGYTLLLASGPLTMTPPLHKKLPYDVGKDFVGIAGLAVSPVILVRHPSTSFKTLPELIELAKKRPDTIRYGTGGVGSTPHLSAALLQSIAGIRLVHVPYRGGGPSMVALAAGEVEIVVNSMTTLLPMIDQNRIVPIVICQPTRSPRLPDVPTAVEAQLPAFMMSHWLGLVAPSKTPVAIQQRLNSEVRKALDSAEVARRFAAFGTETYTGSRETFHRFIQEELLRWAKVVREAGIPPE